MKKHEHRKPCLLTQLMAFLSTISGNVSILSGGFPQNNGKESSAHLSPSLREAIELRFIEGLSCEEAARRLGCSKRAFYMRIERAMKLLRKALEAGQ